MWKKGGGTSEEKKGGIKKISVKPQQCPKVVGGLEAGEEKRGNTGSTIHENIPTK